MVHQIMNIVDFDHNGSLNYSEFLSGTVDTSEYFNDSNLQTLFNFLDNMNQGYLTKESLLKTFNRAGKSYKLDDVTAMLEEMKMDSSVQITKEKFNKIVRAISVHESETTEYDFK